MVRVTLPDPTPCAVCGGTEFFRTDPACDGCGRQLHDRCSHTLPWSTGQVHLCNRCYRQEDNCV